MGHLLGEGWVTDLWGGEGWVHPLEGDWTGGSPTWGKVQVAHGPRWTDPLPPNRMTDACKNITFPHT